MSEDTFRLRLAKILDVDKEELVGEFKLDYENWDSLILVETIAALDQDFGVTVPTEALLACKTLDELLELIRTTKEIEPESHK